MISTHLRQSVLLILLLTACQQPQQTGLNASSVSSTISSSTRSIPCASPTPIPTPVPTPPAVFQSGPLPDIKSLTEADVLRRQEQLQLHGSWLSPDASQVVYFIEREQRVWLKQGLGASQQRSEFWTFNLSNKKQTHLEFDASPFGIHLQWLNSQDLLLAERAGIQGYRLTRYNLNNGSLRVLLESALALSSKSANQNWVYFMREAGKIEAQHLDTDESKQWPLQNPLTGKITIEALPDGKLLLFDDRSPENTLLCVGQCPPKPAVVYLSVFDPVTGKATAIPSFQGTDSLPNSIQASADGRYLAWAHASGFKLLELKTLTQKLQITGAEMLAWLSNEHVLLRYSDHLEVYDILNNRALGQLQLGTNDEVVGYDAATKQLLIKARGNCGSNSQPVLQAWDLSNTSQPGPLRTLPESAQIQAQSPMFGQTHLPFEQPQLLANDSQRRQSSLSFFKLQPQGQGLETIFELPYNANPSFSFDPNQIANRPVSRPWSFFYWPPF